MVNGARKTSGRTSLAAIGGDARPVYLKTAKLNTSNQIAAAHLAVKNHMQVNLTFGKTYPPGHPEAVNNSWTIAIDREAIQIFANHTAGHVSRDGTVTTYHEFLHGEKALAADWASYGNEVAAQAYGEQVYRGPNTMSVPQARTAVEVSFLNPLVPLSIGFGDAMSSGGLIVNGVWTWLPSYPSWY